MIEAAHLLAAHIMGHASAMSIDLVQWNDHPTTTHADVTRALAETIATL